MSLVVPFTNSVAISIFLMQRKCSAFCLLFHGLLKMQFFKARPQGGWPAVPSPGREGAGSHRGGAGAGEGSLSGISQAMLHFNNGLFNVQAIFFHFFTQPAAEQGKPFLLQVTVLPTCSRQGIFFLRDKKKELVVSQFSARSL